MERKVLEAFEKKKKYNLFELIFEL